METATLFRFKLLQAIKSSVCGLYLLLIFLGLLFWRDNLRAEQTSKPIQYEIIPYLWAASLSGTTAAGGEESPPIDSDYSFFSLDNLDGVFSATFSAKGHQWGFLIDYLYVAFKDTFLKGSSFYYFRF